MNKKPSKSGGTSKFKTGIQPKTIGLMTKEKHFYVTGAFISKATFDQMAKRYKLEGNTVKDGKITICYRTISAY